MGIYIKGMEMPKSCHFCELYEADLYWCRAEGKDIEAIGDFEKRSSFCPLVPVPPHCRLIDADALMAEYEKDEKAADEHGREFSFSFKSAGEPCTEWWPVQQKLMDAPTIIEAEEG